MALVFRSRRLALPSLVAQELAAQNVTAQLLAVRERRKVSATQPQTRPGSAQQGSQQVAPRQGAGEPPDWEAPLTPEPPRPKNPNPASPNSERSNPKRPDSESVDSESPEASAATEAHSADSVQTPPAPRRSFWRRYRMPLTALLSLLVLGLVAAASWFLLPIRTVTVSGNHHLTSSTIKELSGLDGQRPFGWLYYGRWRAAALATSPWVEAAHITRQFPDRVHITINERQPVAWQQGPNGQLAALAADGTLLPDYPAPTPTLSQQGDAAGGTTPATAPASSAQRSLPIISGWGPDRSDDALYAAAALSRYNVKSVEYSPTGITIQTDKGTIWSGDRELLLKYAAAIENQSEGSRINLYPWGVSVQK